ncbi:RTA1 like protein-domain-containing protein [Dactylonectria estremocensis]|uniref:RTA1 like protein-domain-containing protein n=1 Tax=Dactylonectria estremocensis TaxID=1079267 RepID=A0A9P9F173_9HYPO|nr:RTA1 like protein-domain-containing protein [Dactylonectria estremocensis]
MTVECGLSCPVADGFYSYDPNLGGNAVLLAAFALLSLVVPYLGFRSWTPLFSATLTMGLLAEVLGFVGRVLLHSTRDSRAYFFLFLFGTVLGPTFISAAIFIVLPHILGIYGETISPFRPVLAGLVFCSLIFVALVVELVGIIFVAYEFSNISQRSGAKITAAGLGIQAVLLLACSGLHFWFTLGVSTQVENLDASHSQVYTSSRFKRFLMGMEVASALLIVYSIYRIVEFAGGVSGTLYQNQTAFMVVGGAIPLLACIILTVFHPGTAFGGAWAATSPGRVKKRSPPPIRYPPAIHATHHRYDPNIRKQFSPMSEKGSRNSVGPPELPAGSPGLPANPRPWSKLPGPQSPQQQLDGSEAAGKRNSTRLERRSKIQEDLVNREELW